MPKRATVLLAALSLVALGVGLAGAALARARAMDMVERGLRRADVEVHARKVALAEQHWIGLRGPGISAARLELRLLPAPRLRLIEPVVDLDALDVEGLLQARAAVDPLQQAPDAAAAALLARWIPALADRASAVVVDGSVRARGEALLTDLNGPLWPQPALEGPDGALGVKDGAPRVQLRRKLELSWVTTQATVDLRCDATRCEGKVLLADCMIDAPQIAPGPLPVMQIEADGTWSRADHRLMATAQVGGLRLRAEGKLVPDPLEFDLELVLEDSPLQAIIDLFGPRVPEARRGQVAGTVGLQLQLAGMPLRWSARPSAKGLGAEGVVPDLDALRGGPIRWTAPGPDGAMRAREVGEGTRGWVPLHAAGLVPAAFMAAEDAEFRTHRGYSMAAVQAAIDDASAEGGWMQRGGSTITQQLVKNLYLDGNDRSLARKLRELLLALEVDRNLSKDRILSLYINMAELGPDMYGLGTAADAYFLKQPARLTAREAAFLATMLPSPRKGHRRYLANDPPDARIDQIIDNMAMMGSIDPRTAERARAEILRLVPPAR